MKKLIMFLVVFAVLAMVFILMLYSHNISERQIDFIQTEFGLRGAHIELHQYGAFTNYSSHMTVYPYTNRVVFGGTYYQCEFAVESDCFRGGGFLTITTNEIFVWIDKVKGVIPLSETRRFPPGF